MDCRSVLAKAVYAALFMGGINVAHAEFALNWAPTDVSLLSGGTANPYANCNRGEASAQCLLNSVFIDGVRAGCFDRTCSDPDKTPFLQERVTGTDGQIYYHTIIGLPTSTFAQETFVRAGGTLWPGGIGSSSMGANFETGQRPLDLDEKTFSGNATANPKRVQFRQINNDGELTMDVRKDLFSNKPLISQTVNGGEVQVQFSVDMRGVSLDDMSQTLPMINKVSVTSSGIPVGAGDFDMARDSQVSRVTAGQYRWIPCTGAGCGPDQSGGSWQYADGGFDPYQVDWKAFRDPSANPAAAIKRQ